MAEDFQPSNWWNTSTSRNNGFDDSSQSIASPPASSFSCSTTVNDVAGAAFSWSSATHEIPESKQLSCFGFSNTLSNEWNQTLLRNSGRAEGSFNAMLQEDLRNRHISRQELGEPSSMAISSKDMNQPFMFSSSLSSSSSSSSSSYVCSPSMLQGVIETDSRFQQQFFDGQQMANYQPQVMANYQRVSSEAQQQASWNQSTQFFKGLPQKQQIAVNQLQFTNNIPSWNSSAGFYSSSSSLSPLEAHVFETKPSTSVIAKSTGGAREKKISSEPALKKPRIETTSSLPAFKVRKEKLGDRITALQQLVSPFGKTDTASVLHEAIEYIKFLHDQVSVLSTPYLKNGHPMQRQQNPVDKSQDEEECKHYLRSRGLCLVPVASTYPMASEATSDFWTPTFGGTYM